MGYAHGNLGLRAVLGRVWPAYFWNCPLESHVGGLVHPCHPTPAPSATCGALIWVLGLRLRTVLLIGAVASPLHSCLPASQPSEPRAAPLSAPLSFLWHSLPSSKSSLAPSEKAHSPPCGPRPLWACSHPSPVTPASSSLPTPPGPDRGSVDLCVSILVCAGGRKVTGPPFCTPATWAGSGCRWSTPKRLCPA